MISVSSRTKESKRIPQKRAQLQICILLWRRIAYVAQRLCFFLQRMHLFSSSNSRCVSITDLRKTYENVINVDKKVFRNYGVSINQCFATKS